jgi:hypothetical protein
MAAAISWSQSADSSQTRTLDELSQTGIGRRVGQPENSTGAAYAMSTVRTRLFLAEGCPTTIRMLVIHAVPYGRFASQLGLLDDAAGFPDADAVTRFCGYRGTRGVGLTELMTFSAAAFDL